MRQTQNQERQTTPPHIEKRTQRWPGLGQPLNRRIWTACASVSHTRVCGINIDDVLSTCRWLAAESRERCVGFLRTRIVCADDTWPCCSLVPLRRAQIPNSEDTSSSTPAERAPTQLVAFSGCMEETGDQVTQTRPSILHQCLCSMWGHRAVRKNRVGGNLCAFSTSTALCIAIDRVHHAFYSMTC